MFSQSSPDQPSPVEDKNQQLTTTTEISNGRRPPLHINTGTPIASAREISIDLANNSPRRRSREMTPSSPENIHTSDTSTVARRASQAPSVRSQRSQRSDQPRVRFSSDVQTMGERKLVSPSITTDEVLAGLHRSSGQMSPNWSETSIRGGLDLSSTAHSSFLGPSVISSNGGRTLSTSSILRGSSSPFGPNPMDRTGTRSTRPRGWSLRRQIFFKTEGTNNSQTRDTEIDMSTITPSPSTSSNHALPSLVQGGMELSNLSIRPQSHDDPDAIAIVTAALNATELGTTSEHDLRKISTSSSEKSPPIIEADTTRAFLPFYSTWASSRRRHIFSENCKRLYRKFRLLRDPRLASKGNGRRVPVNVIDRSKSRHDGGLLVDDRTGREYRDNLITSSRYTVYSFLPRQLWAQFSKIANFYFLVVAIMQMIPGWSTTGNYTTIIPLSFFLSLSMAREGYDDWRRHRQDKVENNKITGVLRVEQNLNTSHVSLPSSEENFQGIESHWRQITWKEIRVGDVVKINRDEWIPADLILLYSAGEKGIAYIETAALDGETNLKSRQALPSVSKHCSTESFLLNFRGEIVSEDPNQDLYSYDGKLVMSSETVPLSNSEILYRGSILRNTPYIYAVAIFTGEETKIRMNASKYVRTKAPSLQRTVNRVVLIVVFLVIVLAIFCTAGYQLWHSSTENHSWYLQGGNISFMPIVASFIILFNTMIPLALYVSMEIIKLAQMVMLQWDVDMYHESSDTPCEARTATINEELGQVSYIFSDKTGTLTDNIMLFRKLTIAGYAWLHDLDIQRELKNSTQVFLKHKKRKGKKALAVGRSLSIGGLLEHESNLTTIKQVNRSHTEPQMYITGDSHSDRVASRSTMYKASRAGNIHRSGTWRSTAIPSKPQQLQTTLELVHLMQTHPHTMFARRARQFLLGIALCHTCIPEFDEELNEFVYKAASPDELALVDAAKELGYIVVDRQVGTITLKTHPNGMDADPVTEVYTILDVIEFSSSRKRMSIILKFPDGRICLFCKGADSVIIERLRLATLAIDKAKEVQTAVNYRRSVEAERAIKARKSITLSRHSMSLARPSMTGSRMDAVRDLDEWLKERQQDNYGADDSSTEDRIGFDARHSIAFGESRIPLETAENPMNIINDHVVDNDATVLERTFQHIQDFATEGLRTLLYGHRFLTEQEYTYWRKVFTEASTSLVDRQEKIEKAAEMIEINLEVSGATAIEDKLQAGVPEAIDKLRRAGIKLWMLTGDKRETAINIGYSCRLIRDYSKVIILDYNDPDMQQTMASARVSLNVENVAHSVAVIDGATLGVIEANGTLYTLFLDLAVEVDSVICCRASPSQKASIVRAVRKKIAKSVTLAIGDGANDIAMIQEAHVGIGITGREGLQAARSSDYSIAQFRFLLKLLLVHGRWFYVRISKYILATFYKEMFFYLTQAMFQASCGYTGTSLMEQYSLSMFNTLFTSLPVFVIGIFDKDLAATTLLAVPELYTIGQKNGAFKYKLYFGWMFIAVSQAAICYFIPFYMFGIPDTTQIGIFSLGNLVYTVCIMVICVKLVYVETRSWTVVNYVTSFVTIFGWYFITIIDSQSVILIYLALFRFLWNIIFSISYGNNLVYQVRGSFLGRMGKSWTYWLAIICAFVTAIMWDVMIITLRVTFFPKDADVFAELEKDPLIKSRFEEEAASELQQGWNRGKMKEVHESHSLLDHPRSMEEGRSSTRSSWAARSLGIKTRTSSDMTSDGETTLNPGGRDIIMTESRKESTTHTSVNHIQEEELARHFGAVIRKPFKRIATSGSA